ncbi:type I-E CRISPR-associated protein Cas7/Cse4/CasC [Corynebacterium sanguinis]|uniref:type I-E CRISPR-associated protein Cas7/Cse4/CasC n=1 Tax=Corynebacterium sanguinis TaxID=2594913 RepID=UPI0021AE9546|nr:type I-E CRISPR-associated protein Cas7/Cse4/CasC [Corynebacterium sanguinis]MCT2287688.1 type I-E CRISPR-associated protein Cas7/Cse4/CasC [Corynebacterium sanguinis]
MSLVIDVHALQTIPPSLINRDDTGAPKSAIFGGVPRQRVSSQSWKRAIRRYFNECGSAESIGARSTRMPEKIARLVQKKAGWDEATSIVRTCELFKAAGIKTAVVKPKKSDEEGVETEASQYPRTGYLLFLSPHQVEKAADLIIATDGGKIEKKAAKEALNGDNSVDVAMFGRMVADDASFNVDAAVQVAHALGIHASSPEFDYFTAVDDLAAEGQETGAGMIGTVQMMSSTLYRYASVNVDGLEENLGSAEAAREAAVHFIDAFAKSLPTGKLNTFANQTLPELVYVAVRDTRPVSLVNAFEEPIETGSASGRRQAAAQALADEESQIEKAYGFVPVAAFVASLGDLSEPFEGIAADVSFAELLDQISDALTSAQGE